MALSVIISSSTCRPWPGQVSSVACCHRTKDLDLHRFPATSCAYATESILSVRESFLFPIAPLSEAKRWYCQWTFNFRVGVHESQLMLRCITGIHLILLLTGPLDNFYLFNITSEEWTDRHGVLKGDPSPSRYTYNFVAISLQSKSCAEDSIIHDNVISHYSPHTWASAKKWINR